MRKRHAGNLLGSPPCSQRQYPVAYLRLSATSVAGTMATFGITEGMPSSRPAPYDRVLERRRAVALARHVRESEGLSNAQIADRFGRSPATIKAYFSDPC